MELVIKQQNPQISPGVRNCILGLMLLCSALTGIIPQTVLSLVIASCMIVLFFLDELYLAFPFLIFYNSLYGVIFGVSLFRIFSLLMLLSCIVKLKVHKPLDAKYFIPIFVYFVYLLVVMSPISVNRAIFAFIDVISSVLLVTGEIKKDEEKLKTFFRVYALLALVAYFTGTVVGNSIEQVERPGFEIVEYSRFMATFEDPNYMGFFYTIAVFATFALKLFKPIFRVVVIVALYIMMLSSLSITAIIVNAALWLVYFAVSGKISPKAFVGIIIVIFLVVAAYYYGLNNKDSGMLGDLAYRISKKLEELQRNDIGAATTGRTDMAAYHLEVYISLPFIQMLFGGISSNTYYIDPILRGAAHNEYVDMLLNIGFIGAVVMLGFFIYTAFGYYKEYRKNGKDKYLLLFMSKTIWALYAFTLTVFLDYRFMFFFLI